MSQDDEKILFGQEHVDRYRETDGEVGHVWRNGTATLLLTTKGRKSGEERTTPLIYRPVGDDAYAIVASKGGAPKPPAWYLNRAAGPDERPHLWRELAEVWPDYDEYQKKTDREIPVVVLERSA